jgi:hypothetical protein
MRRPRSRRAFLRRCYRSSPSCLGTHPALTQLAALPSKPWKMPGATWRPWWEPMPTKIVFTSGGTEANNLALLGIFLQSVPAVDGHLIISALEHPAVSSPATFLERMGVATTVVPSDPQGLVDPEAIRKALRKDTRLVSIIHANNEVGTIQPIREIATICHERACWFTRMPRNPLAKSARR